MTKKIKRLFICIAVVAVIASTFVVPAFATGGNVSGAIEGTWNAAQGQIKDIVNNVVFPVIDMVLVVMFFIKVGTCYFEYKKHGTFEFTGPCILFACLIFTLTAPMYIWTII